MSLASFGAGVFLIELIKPWSGLVVGVFLVLLWVFGGWFDYANKIHVDNYKSHT